MLKHIGYQIKEEDLNPFYKGILNCKVIHKYTLHQEKSEAIFHIPYETSVILIELDGIIMELFIHPLANPYNYNHICIEKPDPTEICRRASIKGYRTHEHKTSNGSTWFLYDSNQNIFEIKPTPYA